MTETSASTIRGNARNRESERIVTIRSRPRRSASRGERATPSQALLAPAASAREKLRTASDTWRLALVAPEVGGSR